MFTCCFCPPLKLIPLSPICVANRLVILLSYTVKLPLSCPRQGTTVDQVIDMPTRWRANISLRRKPARTTHSPSTPTLQSNSKKNNDYGLTSVAFWIHAICEQYATLPPSVTSPETFLISPIMPCRRLDYVYSGVMHCH